MSRPPPGTASSVAARSSLAASAVEAITRLCRGFVYAVSLSGHHRRQGRGQLERRWRVVARIREHTSLPRRRSASATHRRAGQARSPGIADGVIVGSAFVRRIAEAATQADAVAAVREPHRGPGAGRPPRITARARCGRQPPPALPRPSRPWNVRLVHAIGTNGTSTIARADNSNSARRCWGSGA